MIPTSQTALHIIQAFYLGQFEVSVAQFSKFIEASGYIPESVADGTAATDTM
jgi:formylglycine-generating enzyme required for sulfatase activity